MCFSSRQTSASRVVATLDPANTHDLDHLAPEADGRAVESLLVGVDARALPDEVGLVGADDAGAFDEFPAEEEDDGCGDGVSEGCGGLEWVWGSLPRMGMV